MLFRKSISYALCISSHLVLYVREELPSVVDECVDGVAGSEGRSVIEQNVVVVLSHLVYYNCL